MYSIWIAAGVYPAEMQGGNEKKGGDNPPYGRENAGDPSESPSRDEISCSRDL